MIFLYPSCVFELLCVSQGKQKGFIRVKGCQRQTQRGNNCDGWNKGGIVKKLTNNYNNNNNNNDNNDIEYVEFELTQRVRVPPTRLEEEEKNLVEVPPVGGIVLWTFSLSRCEWVFPELLDWRYRYCRMLEEGSFRGRTADFVFMFLFGGLLMTVSSHKYLCSTTHGCYTFTLHLLLFESSDT